MILQLANIVSGAVLALPDLKEYATNKESLEKIEMGVQKWRVTIGRIEFVLGLIGLLERVGLFPVYLPEFGSSFPQAIPAVLAGLLLSLPAYEKYPGYQRLIGTLKPHAFWLGLLAIAVGLGSLLFGCFITPFCSFRY